jgi:hypothetical protein
LGDAGGIHGGGGGHDGLLRFSHSLVCTRPGRELLHYNRHLGAQLRYRRLHTRDRKQGEAATALAAQRGGCGHHGRGNVRVGDEALKSQ